MRPIIISVLGSPSSVAAKIVEQLVTAGATAYNGFPSRLNLQTPLVVNWAQGGDKFYELSRLARAGVPTPRHSQAPLPGWIPRRRHHQEALDFTNPPECGDFWTEPTYTDNEFRVHVIHGSAFRIQHKYLQNGVHPLVKYGVPIRNHSLGWTFNPNPDFPRAVLELVRDAARAAVRALGYDMGAVDVGFIWPDAFGRASGEAGKPVVFEINTRPSMDEYTRTAYVQALLKLASQ